MTSNLSRKDDFNQADIFEIFFKNITQSLPNYIFWKDTQSVYLGCNKNFARLVGLHRPEEIVGKTDQDLNWQPLGHSAEKFQQSDYEEILALPNGKKVVALVSKLPILDENHRILGMVGYFTDITLLKKKEIALQRAKRQAEAATQAKSAFISNISHDLRTPLTGLLGMAELLQQEVQSAQGKAAAADLLNAGQVLLNLLNEVIEFSRCESGNLPVQKIKFDLLAVIQSMAELLKPSAQEKKLEYRINLDKNLPRYVMSDAVRLKRILLNLLSNAIKFTHQGHVEFSARVIRRTERGAMVEFQVRDTGIGIPKDQHASIFTRFHRLHPAYEGQYPGAGLGLTLVKEFVEDLKGEIHIESTEGQGSTFSCLIPLLSPLSKKAQNAPLMASPQSLPISKKPLSVLVVEDNLIVQQGMKNLLKSLDVQVHIADGGPQALEKIHTDNYSLIIMDLGLPGQDGYEVTKEIHQWQRENNRQLSLVVALSAHLGKAERQRCLSIGMIGAYEKPLSRESAEELLRLVTILKPLLYQDSSEIDAVSSPREQVHSYSLDYDDKTHIPAIFFKKVHIFDRLNLGSTPLKGAI